MAKHIFFRRRNPWMRKTSDDAYSWSRFQYENGIDPGPPTGYTPRVKIRRITRIRLDGHTKREDRLINDPTISVFRKIVKKMEMKKRAKEVETITLESDIEDVDTFENSSERIDSLFGSPNTRSAETMDDDDIEIIYANDEEFLEEIPLPTTQSDIEKQADLRDDVICIGVVEAKDNCSSVNEIETSSSTPVSENTIAMNFHSELNYAEHIYSNKNVNVDDCFNRSLKFIKNQRWKRVWESTRNVPTLQPKIEADIRFIVCSYNVLCQETMLRTGYLYTHLNSTPQFATWEHRWNLFRRELVDLKADIIGLQEVQEDHYFHHYSPLMVSKDYIGHYKGNFGNDDGHDGCAIFYRSSLFEELEYIPVNYFVNCSVILNREKIGQIIVLRCRVTGERLVVANTHLTFNCERGDVKLAQLAVLFANIFKVMQKYEKNDGSGTSLIILGDFNIEPYSLIYEFIVNGKVYIDDVPIRTMSGQSDRIGGKVCRAQQLLSPNITGISLNSMFCDKNGFPKYDGFIRHPFRLASVHTHGLDRKRRREISTFHKDACNPDFIFYSMNGTKKKRGKQQVIGTPNLNLLKCYTLPTMEQLSKTIPLPNEHVPSDHLPLLAKFRLQRTRS